MGAELARYVIEELGPDGLLELWEALRSVTMAVAPMRMTGAGTGPQGPTPRWPPWPAPGPQGPTPRRTPWPAPGPEAGDAAPGVTAGQLEGLCARTGARLLIGSKVVDPAVMRICAAIHGPSVSAHTAVRVAEAAAKVVRLAADPAADDDAVLAAVTAVEGMARALSRGSAMRLVGAVVVELRRSRSSAARSFGTAMIAGTWGMAGTIRPARPAPDGPGMAETLRGAAHGPDGPPAAPEAGSPFLYGSPRSGDPVEPIFLDAGVVTATGSGAAGDEAVTIEWHPDGAVAGPAPANPAPGRRVLVSEEVFLQVEDEALGGSFAGPEGVLLAPAIAPETHYMVDLPLRGGGTEPVLVPRDAVTFLD